MSRPQFDQINIVSADMEAALAFYRRLGVDIPDDRVWRTSTGAHHASAVEAGGDIDLDSAKFAAVWNSGWRGRGELAGRVVVGFSVASREEVDRLYAEMSSAGHRGLTAPYDAFWGARYAVLEDPDGVAVGLMSPISDAHRSSPPEI